LQLLLIKLDQLRYTTNTTLLSELQAAQRWGVSHKH